MRYSIFSIDMGSVNLGNRLIEYSLLKLLELPKPEVKISMFCKPSKEGIESINQTEFLLLPGSTILAGDAMQSQALSCLSEIKVPVYCFGASGWEPYYKYNPEYLKNMTQPIGVRDPHALDFCLSQNVEAVLVGCPTMHMPNFSITVPEEYNVVGFARDNHGWQKTYLSDIEHRKCAIQEPIREGTLAGQLSQKGVFSYDNPNEVFKIYSKALRVYTGRLHGALPAASQRKPVYFFGAKKDSRFTLLDYIGIRVHEMNDNVELDLDVANAERMRQLKDNFYKMTELTTGRHKK